MADDENGEGSETKKERVDCLKLKYPHAFDIRKFKLCKCNTKVPPEPEPEPEPEPPEEEPEPVIIAKEPRKMCCNRRPKTRMIVPYDFYINSQKRVHRPPCYPPKVVICPPEEVVEEVIEEKIVEPKASLWADEWPGCTSCPIPRPRHILKPPLPPSKRTRCYDPEGEKNKRRSCCDAKSRF